MRGIRIPTSRGDLCGVIEMPCNPGKPVPGVIFLHGFTSDRNESPIFGTDDSLFECAARELTEAGFATLRFDFGGHGASRNVLFEDIDLPCLVDDALASISYFAEQPGISTDLLLVGQSMGGLIAACVAHQDDRIRAVALWNAPSNPLYTLWSTMGSESIAVALSRGIVEFPWDGKGQFNLKRRFFESLVENSVLAEMSQFDGRLLVVAGLKDTLVHPQPQTAAAFLNVHKGVHRLLVLDSDHTFNTALGRTQELNAAIQETISWFSSSINS
jgi:uncharacterized protein